MDLVGKKIKTKFGTAKIESYITSLQCWHVVYPDSSMGWVKREQFELLS